MSIRQQIYCLLAETKLTKPTTDTYGGYQVALNPSRNMLIRLVQKTRYNTLRMVVFNGNVAVGDAYGLTHDDLNEFINDNVDYIVTDRINNPAISRGFIYAKPLTKNELASKELMPGWYHLYDDWAINVTNFASKPYNVLPLALRRVLK
ncbi:MAG TPA: hypothetical protein VNX68_15995 [Nitrosopumilaceae archaeon]|jgi:hypothetical protein|nr:hypothetical protein [Nitrosopumilaceae archaeon]